MCIRDSRMTVPEARAEALANRGRNLPGYGGCGVCGSADIESVMRTPPRIESTTSIDEAALHRALAALHARQPLTAAPGSDKPVTATYACLLYTSRCV